MISSLYSRLDRLGFIVLPTLSRFVFAAVLWWYYVKSGLSKFEGLSLSAGAYVQILPKAMEAVGYDSSQLSFPSHVIVFAGSVTEIILPVLIVIGLLTRPAAVAMIGFVVVQSVVDVIGHGLDAATIGAWFDRFSSALVLDQRAFWVLGLSILVFMGPGPLSLDRLIAQRTAARV